MGDVPRYAIAPAVATLKAERDGMLAQLRQSAPGYDMHGLRG